jgi:peptidoglycan-associated lipoprotein
MKRISLCFVLLFGLIVIGCAEKKMVKEQPEEYQPTVTVHETQKRTSDTTEVQPEEKITEQQFAKIESKEEPLRYTEVKDVFEDIYFNFDEYNIRDDAKPVLENIASWLLKNKSAKILIEGHCDPRGTNEYNLALGDRRAKATKDYLGALGIASNRIEMLSYGEEKPLCFEESEECWAKNRRAHFVVLKEAHQ